MKPHDYFHILDKSKCDEPKKKKKKGTNVFAANVGGQASGPSVASGRRHCLKNVIETCLMFHTYAWPSVPLSSFESYSVVT